MLELLRLSPRRLFPPGGRDLYRQIALLTGMSSDQEILVVACGHGTTLEYFVREFGVHGAGVDSDTAEVTRAVDRARTLELGSRMQIQEASSQRLPYRDGIFHVVVGELGLAADEGAQDGAAADAAVRELVRVARPGAPIALVQLVWKAPVDDDTRAVFTEHLGLQPRMLVEWKRVLREAGVQNIRTEDWSDATRTLRGRSGRSFPDFAQLFSLREKAGILWRAWRQWGIGGVRAVLGRERSVRRMLNRERVLGLDLLVGVKQVADSGGSVTTGVERGSPVGASQVDRGEDPDRQVQGLPLFGDEGETD